MTTKTLGGWLGCLVLMTSISAYGSSLSKTKSLVSQTLRAWDVDEATGILSTLTDKERQKADVLYLRGWAAFLQSRYAESIELLESATQTNLAKRPWKDLLELARNTHEITKNHTEIPSSKGHFLFSLHPGVDEVLITYADEALEAAYESLGDLLSHRPTTPVRVEILGDVQNLAALSPLKLSEVRTTGTIALCQYNRLVLVSPRSLIYGYRWLDALVHEYVHFIIAHRTHKQAPIWLDEGLAKFFENRWRQHSNGHLSRTDEDRLARALRQKKLIPFRVMSPSIAKLSSQEDAALAYAQVFTAIELLFEKVGMKGINRMLDAMRDGATGRKAIAEVTRKSFPRFERDWRRMLASRHLRALPFGAHERLLYRDTDKPSDELKGIEEKKGRQLAYLGDRLSVRSRYKAAAIEYEKALKEVGGAEPAISAKLAYVLLKQGHHRRAIQIVTPALRLHHNHVLLYLYRGKARLAIGEYESAREDLQEAIRINPFDPEVHGLLANALEKLGRIESSKMEQRQQRLVMAN
jgi:tetratricopeptide (TPR) repeat protein